ncbi:hypothetical protein E4P41_13230 [Geodermatophilus sp. DF01-2]|uniref:hypothetical protein n=1 Tax=Geodermatophilus sp. DF01-2 TaxID=2559610 RepID=UPI0010736B0C|nr:hypothetical protein [Geodermatophilus sp. DF01_2]TFV58308.1 hypothetical protein E4P41_13230 [Geodermatophilus sp. DF01_2]
MDLAAFADPGTRVSFSPVRENVVRATWDEDGRSRSARFRLDESGPTHARFDEEAEQLYRSFLAGQGMGNLRALARNILQVIPEFPGFIPSLGRLEGVAPTDGDAAALLLAAAESSPDFTNVVFVAADAGLGKTVLLKQVVRDQARRYLAGEVTSLWLYVDAQARRLAALDEAMAGELDRIRAKFSYDAAVPLVRTGALTLVVDGFDELIGSVGAYDEAFNSLADFIGGLEGGGTLVAAARSAYYEQEFLARVGRGLGRGERWRVRPLRLKEWGPTQRKALVLGEADRRGLGIETGERAYLQVEEALAGGELAGVAGKPFFVDRTADLILDGGITPEGARGGLLDRLVNAYLERDAGKLLSAAKSPLLSVDALRSFFDELAFEMWRQETRELSRASVRELASLLGEMEGLDEDGVREVATRAPYLAMLREGSLPGSVGWEHDVYFAHFLSRPLSEGMEDGDARKLARLLRRGRLPEEAALLAGKLTHEIPSQGLIDLLAAAVLSEDIDMDRVRRNAGLLAGGRLAGERHEGLRLHGLRVGDISLGSAEFVACMLDGLDLGGTDLTGTRFLSCEAITPCLFQRVVVAPSSTVLEIGDIPVDAFQGVILRGDASDRWLYSPNEIRDTLNACGLPAAAPELTTRRVDPAVLNLLERVCKVFAHTNFVAEAADNDFTVVTRDGAWPFLRKALIDSGLVVPRVRQASGHKTFLERTVPPAIIMAGLDVDATVPSEVAAFWERLETDSMSG